MPDIEAMRKDLFSVGVSNPDHYKAIQEVYEQFSIIIEPHGAVGWRVLDTFLSGKHDRLAVIYETADPGKFPDDIREAIDITPDVPDGIAKQTQKQERIYSIDEPSEIGKDGSMTLSDAQYNKAQNIIKDIFSN